MLKCIVNGVPKDIIRIPMFDNGVEHEGWEVRDQQGRIIWGANKTLTGIDSISFKGYGLPLKEYDIDGNMAQAAEKAYSISGTSPLDFQSNGSNATISISGNETQASNQAYTISGTSPLSFNADRTDLTALSMDGNMNQASSQSYIVSGTSPISFMNNGTAIDYTVSGSMLQSGTPTPTTPIIPEECGEKMANLFDYTVTTDTIDNSYINKRTTSVATLSTYYVSYKIPVTVGKQYVWVFGRTDGQDHSAPTIGFYDNTDTLIGSVNHNDRVTYFTFIVPSGCVYIRASVYKNTKDQAMLLGEPYSEFPEAIGNNYIPYGYKIPITNGSTTYNIYLSEPLRKIEDYADIVNSDGNVTRQIKKLVLTGEENWYIEGSDIFYTDPITEMIWHAPICNHYTGVYALSGNNQIAISQGLRITIKTNNIAHTVTDFKAFLAQQYANGTPVTVWYVLSTPITETITTPIITPVSGNNTLTVDTTLAPSNITITSNSSVFPGNPIIPIECGVKTGQIISYPFYSEDGVYSGVTFTTNNGRIVATGTLTGGLLYYLYRVDKFPPGTYTLSVYGVHRGAAIYFRDVTNSVQLASIFAGQPGDRSVTFTVLQEISVMVYINATGSSPTDVDFDCTIMLNNGDTPLPFSPNPYKLPITISEQTQNVYTKEPIRKIGNYSDIINSDGTVTRQIKKLVLTGDELGVNKRTSPENSYSISFNSNGWASPTTGYGISSHFTLNDSVTTLTDGLFYVGSTTFSFRLDDCTDVTAFKQFLAAQYSAGTPVEVWYVLATPDTTETTTIPTISTVNGANTLTTGTPITPSNITISTSSSVYPKNPIYPEECGDRTENLFDKTSPNVVNAYYDTNTNLIIPIPNNAFVYVPIIAGKTYYVSGIKRYDTETQIRYCTTGTVPAGGINVIRSAQFAQDTGLTITAKQGESYLAIFVCGDSDYSGYGSVNDAISANCENLIIDNGYAISITINSTTQNIYLSEPIRKIGNYSDIINSDGSITRHIKKMVLTGDESYSEFASWKEENTSVYYTDAPGMFSTYTEAFAISSHFEGIGRSVFQYADSPMISPGGDAVLFRINTNICATNIDFKQWIADEYSANHPVEVWYVLAEPTTEQTTISTLTTVNGANTTTIGTTLAPSSITINAASKLYPNNPIYPEECGNETQNLYDKAITNGVTDGYYINKNTQQEQALSTYEISYPISVEVGQTYKWMFNDSDGQTHSAPTVGYYDNTDTMIGVANHERDVTEFEFTVPAGCTYIRASVYKPKKDQAMLIFASEEQGIYIPITFNGVTQKVWLDEPLCKIGNHVDILSSNGTTTGTVTREIKKLVFNGKESWTSANGVQYLSSIDDYLKTAEVTAVCSHYPVQSNAGGTGDVEEGKMCFGTNKNLMRLFIKDSNYSTLADWKTYLAAQFAAGTPVTVWYILAEPTVEHVTVPVLTTYGGENTMEIGTTLSSSNISITGHIKSIGYTLTDVDDYIIKDVYDYIITVEE